MLEKHWRNIYRRLILIFFFCFFNDFTAIEELLHWQWLHDLAAEWLHKPSGAHKTHFLWEVMAQRELLISMTCEQLCKSNALWWLSVQNNALLIKSLCNSTATSGVIFFHVCMYRTELKTDPFHRIIFAWEIRIITWRLLVFTHHTHDFRPGLSIRRKMQKCRRWVLRIFGILFSDFTFNTSFLSSTLPFRERLT